MYVCQRERRMQMVCDLSKLDDRGCLGAPDLIIEIVSPKNSKRDIKDKFEIYQEHGIREYWIVNPNDENVSVFVLDEDGKYQLKAKHYLLSSHLKAAFLDEKCSTRNGTW